MRKALNVLTALVVIVTLAAVCLGGWAYLHLEPRIQDAGVTIMPAEEAEALFANWQSRAKREVFPGAVLEAPEGDAADYCFEAYTVRLANRGFFPAEWISLIAEPREGDTLIEADSQDRVLNPRTEGDLVIRTLCEKAHAGETRTLRVVCGILGEEHVIRLAVAGH